MPAKSKVKSNRLAGDAKQLAGYFVPYWQVYVTAGLLGLAGQNFHLGWLTLVALVPLLCFLHAVTKRGWRRLDFFNIWLGGVVMYLGVLLWVTHTDPVTWTPIEGHDGKVALYGFYFLMVWLLSLSWLAVGAILALSRRWIGSSPVRLVLAVAAAWTATELLRTLLVSVVIWSPDVYLGAHWGFGMLGFLSANTPLVFVSRLVGVSGATAAVIAVNGAWFLVWQRQWRAALVIAAGLAMLLSAGWLPYQTEGTRTVTVGAVQLNAEVDDVYMSGLHETATAANLSRPLDVLVTPEYFNLFENADAANRQRALELLADDDTVIITSSSFEEEPNQTPTNRLFFYDKHGTELAHYDKNILVPGGEYLPVGTEAILNILGQQSLVDEFNAHKAVTKGSQPEQVFARGSLRIGALACSGVVSPLQYQHLARDNPDLLTNSASLGIFGSSWTYFEQAKQMARLQAVAHNKPFIQSAAGSTSYMIDRNGQTIVRSTQPEQPVELLTSEVTVGAAATPYSRWGEWVWLVGLIGSGLVVLAARRRRS